MLAILLDAIKTREDQPSKDRLALTPIVGECEELDRVTARGYVSLRVCGVSGCAAFGCCTALNCFRAFALRIQALTAFGGFSRLVGCFCLFPLSAHCEQLRVSLFLRPVLLLVVEYLFVAPLAGAARGGGVGLVCEGVGLALAGLHVEGEGAHRQGRRSFVSVVLMLVAAALFATGGGILVNQMWWSDHRASGVMSHNLSVWDEAHADQPKVTTVASVKHYDDPPGSASIPPEGNAYGVLHVPSWDHMRIPASSGYDQETILDNGWLGFDPQAAYPGTTGVAVGFGHRRTNGSNLFGIDRFQAGDHVIMETESAWIVFDYADSSIIEPTDVEAAYSAPSGYPSDGRYLNLVTCTSTAFGAYGNDHRHVARFVMSYWVDKSEGVPAELGGDR